MLTPELIKKLIDKTKAGEVDWELIIHHPIHQITNDMVSIQYNHIDYIVTIRSHDYKEKFYKGLSSDVYAGLVELVQYVEEETRKKEEGYRKFSLNQLINWIDK